MPLSRIQTTLFSGDISDSVLRSLLSPPAPTEVTATAGNAQATVTWSAPTVLTQTPITDYIVQYSSNSGSTWTTFSDSLSTTASITVTGLSNGTSYVFRVAGVNGVGQGPYSSATSSVTPSPVVSVSYLLVGGGGGGGSERGAGGGAGGYLYNSETLAANSAISITVGNGGTGGNSANGTSGESTVLSQDSTTRTALGGGYGARGLTGLFGLGATNGGSGGSGGGGSGYNPTGSGGAGTVGQGFAGGSGNGSDEPYNGGSGGGAGGAGSTNGNGGTGISDALLIAASAGSIVNGTPYVGGGGGAGVYQSNGGSGGSGGGGAGGGTNENGLPGETNTGGGGGGGGNAANGGSGGSGLAILRCSDTFTATTTGSPTVYVSGGYRYYKFTQNGTITFVTA
jgi:hypothetical protein